MKGTNVELTFENLDYNNYYPVSAHNYDGYFGFNFADMGLLTANAIKFLGYGNFTGYSSVLSGTTCDFTYVNAFGQGGGSGLGEFVPLDKHETFNLQSGTFASAWDSSQPTYFEALNSKGHVTATLEVDLGQSATTVDFAKYGSEFKGISGFKIISEKGTAGKYGFAGYQIAMDNIYVHWNGKIPMEHRAHGPAIPHAVAAQLASSQHSAWFDHSTGADMTHATAQDHDYHSMISALADTYGHSGGGGLTADFSLPQMEHHLGA
ncbi:MAG TPA: hypothetical protein VHY79_11935 [Rhizomicrobium sp.]|jgi:hypothetical protein|nr:hypothetical protein [Rhizomicrobium sp.]